VYSADQIAGAGPGNSASAPRSSRIRPSLPPPSVARLPGSGHIRPELNQGWPLP
jgi:hypothetical protein